MSDYEAELMEARRVGVANATDTGVMALFCDTSLQQMCGAVAPRLVFDGAQKAGMSAKQLAELAGTDPELVHDLMWR